MAAPAIRPSGAASLAPELLHLVFAPLSQPEILTVAAVCSWWRACAMQHPMYYRAWVFDLPTGTLSSLNYGPGYESMKKLERLVREAEVGRYHIGLSVSVHLDSGYGGGSPLESYDTTLESSDDSDEQSSLAEARAQSYRATLDVRLVPLLRRALVRCVVLKVSCDVSATAIIWKALSLPPPLLRRLKISIENYRTPEQSALSPADFLSGDAPRLTDVSLIRACVSASSPCFPSVRILLLDCPPDLSTARAAFPGTKHLTIQRLGAEFELSAADHAMFTGLNLLRLGPEDVEIPKLLPALLANAHIPLIEYCGTDPDEFSELLPASGEVSAQIFEHLSPRRTFALYRPTRLGQLCLEFRSGGVIRRVDSDVAFSTYRGLSGLNNTLRFVTDMTIDDRHVRTLFQTGASLPALRVLRITLVTWAPSVPPAADEELIYATDHARSACTCLCGLFGDRHDGSCPDGEVRFELAALETLELRATRPRAVVPLQILRALSRSFGSHVHLVLSNGLSLADELDAAPLFASITSPDRSFCATLSYVVRSAGLLDAAASRRKIALRDTDRAIRRYGPSFHWDHCREPSVHM